MEESLFVDFLKKLSIEELKKLEKNVRTNIIKCFDEMYMFRDAMKDVYSYFEYDSQIVIKLRKLYWL